MIRRLILLVPLAILVAQAIFARPERPTTAVWLLVYGAIAYGAALGWRARARRISATTLSLMPPILVVVGLALCGIGGLSAGDLAVFAGLPASYGVLTGWMARRIYAETPCKHGRWILRRFPDGATARVCRACVVVEYLIAGRPAAAPARRRNDFHLMEN